jgi:Mg2+ and Co2+ transporter CorA
MSDIVERLYGLANEHYEMLGDIHKPLEEAADEITRLTARVEELEQVLRDLTAVFAANCYGDPNDYITYESARAALTQPAEEKPND